MMNLGSKMPGGRHFPRIDTVELKHHIEMRIGKAKSDKYFNLVNSYLNMRLGKIEFDKLCVGLLGRENISLHNGLIRAILRNACIEKFHPSRVVKGPSSLDVKVRNGYQSSLQSFFPQSPRRGRTPAPRDHRYRDWPSPLGPHGKARNVPSEDLVQKIPEQQSATEILSLGSRPPVEVTSVEEGEEVEQGAGCPGIHSLSPLRPPFGVCIPTKRTHGSNPCLFPYNCCRNGEFPDTVSLREMLEKKLRMEGLTVSEDCANLLNNGLNVFLKRLLKHCLDLTSSRSEHNIPSTVHHQPLSRNNIRPQKPSISMTDFQAAIQLNPWILGEDWPVQLEKVCSRACDDFYCDSRTSSNSSY